jgi:uncharacterized membrane protein YeaQ/YmgE (transglycosylase-associated protein family)
VRRLRWIAPIQRTTTPGVEKSEARICWRESRWRVMAEGVQSGGLQLGADSSKTTSRGPSEQGHRPRTTSVALLTPFRHRALLEERKAGAMDLIIALIVGGIIGWLASIIMKTNAQMGLLANIIIGIVGSLLGYFLAGTLGIATAGVGRWVVGVLGAALLIGILKALNVFK